MYRTSRIGLCALLVLSTAAVAAAAGGREPLSRDAIAQLKAEVPGARVSVDTASGAARFVRLPAGSVAGGRAATVQAKQERAVDFLMRHGDAFGLRNAGEELDLRSVLTDRQGQTHLTFGQTFAGVPVFGTVLKAHFDASGELRVVNGKVLSDIRALPIPRIDAREASRTAVRYVGGGDVTARGTRLLVFREGLAKGVPGDDHLAWEVVVGNGTTKRDFVYVDAHTGKVVDRIAGVHDALDRRAYNALGFTAPGPNYPGNPFWVEGQAFPTFNVEADNMILASGETYDMYSKAFGRDSFNGAGATMDSIFNRGNGCPNASWNGTFISFCPGLTTDDVTAHEWTHAYTEYTHGLIYQWQPGALNESYSDIFGETLDRINGRGGDTPDATRTALACSSFTALPPTVTVNSPASIAGVKSAGTAAFGPQSFGLTSDLVVANDGDLVPADGCCAGPSFICAPNSWPNAAAVAGKVAVVDRGVCGFVIKAKNAQDQGAIGLIVVNSAAGIINMAGVDPTVVIPSLSMLQTDGNAVKAALGSGAVNATLSRGAVGADNSVRWLLGEDDSAPGLTGALRDMWTPTCYGNPGKVSDIQYSCSTADSGGVHNNSGVPNHAYALLVDGGSYNGQSVTGIGLTKAAHIYYRAMTVYQGPASDFTDHADALDQSCADLIGVDLKSLTTGAPSGQAITAADCAQIPKAAAAVQLRMSTAFCGFQPLLAQNPPPLCAAGKVKKIFEDGFDHGDSSTDRWTVSHNAVTPADFTPRDWVVSASLPDGRSGKAWFGIDPDLGTCGPGGDESAVLHLDSPRFKIKNGVTAPMLVFDHWVATEPGFDGGNLKISVNGGPWQLVQAAHFVYNPYNTTLVTAAGGNTNPIAGQPAFSGTDGGAVDGTWGRSIVNLAPYAGSKDEVQLRFDVGNDGCSGRFGWYVDDLQVYHCE